MEISVDIIKELRESTGCGVMECKRALQEAKGDPAKAKEILIKRGMEIAAKKSSRQAKEGRVDSYVHIGQRLAVLVEVNCESDFVARNENFCQFTKDLCMHIAALNPTYKSRSDVPPEILEGITDKETFYKAHCLMDQLFVKDSCKTIQEYMNSLIAQTGENIIVGRYVRFKVGESE